ncbi:MAG TPA: pyruvate formate lyase family protein [Armatimonadota bacterium]
MSKLEFNSVSIFQVVDALRIQALAREPELSASSAPRREARLQRRTFEALPVGVDAGSSLAGGIGWTYATPVDRAAYRRILDEETAPNTLTDTHQEMLAALWQGWHIGGNYTWAHTCADYPRIITNGLQDVCAEIAAHLLTATGEKHEMLSAMRESVEAVGIFAGRFADVAEQAACTESDPAQRARYTAMADACRQVPMAPARSFREALQAIWLVHLAIGISDRSSASLSLGRLDQYLWPFYQQERALGAAPDELRGTLRDFFRLLNTFGDAACAVNLGGLDADDQDLWNELSFLILEVAKELALPSPILAARLHALTPDAVFAALFDTRLVSNGQPTFYGERACRAAMLRRGVPAADAQRFAVNSCMGLVIPGEEISDMWGAVINLPIAFEMALNDGQPFKGALPVSLDVTFEGELTSIEALWARYKAYAAAVTRFAIACNADAAQRVAREAPNPFLSAITRGCIDRAADRAWEGANYHSIIIEGFGWVNVADALVAIEQLVFKEQRFTLAEVVTAARADFVGPKGLLIQRALLACPKYGNGDPVADAMAARVTAAFAEEVAAHAQRNRYYLPSLHTLNTHIEAGGKTAATLDGRNAGAPLGKQLGPMPGRNLAGMTGVILSASAIDQAALSGGQALDLSLSLDQFDDPAWRAAFRTLLLTYFERGGLQIQVNGVDAARLEAAIADPAAHQELIVRIAGFSMRFVELTPMVQREMVERARAGL